MGCAVAWVTALYTERGARRLIWNTLFGTVGAALAAFALSWAGAEVKALGLFTAVPAGAAAAIAVGHAIRRRVRSGKDGQPQA